jgi:hypothetical protein
MAAPITGRRRRNGLKTAVNGQTDAIVSFNHADYKDAPRRFGIHLWKPAEALREIRK